MGITYGFITSSIDGNLSPSFSIFFSITEIINVYWFCSLSLPYLITIALSS